MRVACMAWLESMHARNVFAPFDLFKVYREVGFWVGDITYGLHLSDRSILNDLDTEMTVLPAVIGQDQP